MLHWGGGGGKGDTIVGDQYEKNIVSFERSVGALDRSLTNREGSWNI